MAILNFNYNQAIDQARQIDNVANDMLNAANRQLQATLDSIGVCWQGDASRQFIGYCTTTQTYIRAESKKLQDLANRIREVAKIIREAEERAIELQRRQSAASPSGSDSGGGGGRSF